MSHNLEQGCVKTLPKMAFSLFSVLLQVTSAFGKMWDTIRAFFYQNNSSWTFPQWRHITQGWNSGASTCMWLNFVSMCQALRSLLAFGEILYAPSKHASGRLAALGSRSSPSNAWVQGSSCCNQAKPSRWGQMTRSGHSQPLSTPSWRAGSSKYQI